MLYRNVKSNALYTAKRLRNGDWQVGNKRMTEAVFAANYVPAPDIVPVEKPKPVKSKTAAANPKRSPQHLAKVRRLPCFACGKPGPSEAAHSNQQRWGKGKSTKASDFATFPLCHECHVRHDKQRPSGWQAFENEAIVNTLISILEQQNRLT